MDLVLFKKKFRAWWEGYDFHPDGEDIHVMSSEGGVSSSEAYEPGQPSDPSKETEKNGRDGKPIWTATRVEVAQRLWGDGYVGPGDAEFILTLVKPLGLDPSMSLLNIGAGLGGEARDIVDEFDTWVTCFEESKLLVEHGNQLSKVAGMGKKAELILFDCEDFSVNKKYDAVFSKEIFFRVEDKGKLFDDLEACLKDKGQLVFTDFALEEGAEETGDMLKWSATERTEPHLWTVAQMTDEMSQRNLQVRTNEDFTEEYKEKIIYALSEFTKFCENVDFDNETKIAVMAELDLWGKRLSVLGKGVQLIRYYVRKL